MAGVLSNTGASGNGPLGLGILPKIQARIQAITHPTPPGPKIVSHTMQNVSGTFKSGQPVTLQPIKAVAGGSVYVFSELSAFFAGVVVTDNAGNTYTNISTTRKTSQGTDNWILPNAMHFGLFVADNVNVPSSGQLTITITVTSGNIITGMMHNISIALSGTANPSLDAIGTNAVSQGATASASVPTSAANDLVLAFFLTQGTAPTISGGTLLDTYYDSTYVWSLSDAYAVGSSSGSVTVSAAVQNPSTSGALGGYWEAQAISIKAATPAGG